MREKIYALFISFEWLFNKVINIHRNGRKFWVESQVKIRHNNRHMLFDDFVTKLFDWFFVEDDHNIY